jgi:hypothetical protein
MSIPESKYPCPMTLSLSPGFVVPIPTFPEPGNVFVCPCANPEIAVIKIKAKNALITLLFRLFTKSNDIPFDSRLFCAEI